MNLRDHNIFIFTHIPKCGGTSFRNLINDSALKAGLDMEDLYIPGFNGLDNNKNIDQLSDKEKAVFKGSSYKVVAAHSKYNLHRNYELENQSPFYYTILRDPVKRFVSHYHFFYYKLGYDDLRGVEIGDLKEDKLLFLLKRLSNIQTGYLANFKFKKVLGEDNLLKLAKYNLQYEYEDFGLVEEMEESISRLKEIMPTWLPISGSLPTLNTSNSSKHSLSDKISEMIADFNSSDMDLYSFAQNLKFKNLKVEV